MSYSVRIKDSAAKKLTRLPKDARERIVEAYGPPADTGFTTVQDGRGDSYLQLCVSRGPTLR